MKHAYALATWLLIVAVILSPASASARRRSISLSDPRPSRSTAALASAFFATLHHSAAAAGSLSRKDFRLADVYEIQSLIDSCYAVAVDRKDFTKYVSCFSADGLVDYSVSVPFGAGPPLAKATEMAESLRFQLNLLFGVTMHQTSSFEIVFHDDADAEEDPSSAIHASPTRKTFGLGAVGPLRAFPSKRGRATVRAMMLNPMRLKLIPIPLPFFFQAGWYVMDVVHDGSDWKIAYLEEELGWSSLGFAVACVFAVAWFVAKKAWGRGAGVA